MSTKLTSDDLVTPGQHSSKPFGFVKLIILENGQSKIKQTFISFSLSSKLSLPQK